MRNERCITRAVASHRISLLRCVGRPTLGALVGRPRDETGRGNAGKRREHGATTGGTRQDENAEQRGRRGTRGGGETAEPRGRSAASPEPHVARGATRRPRLSPPCRSPPPPPRHAPRRAPAPGSRRPPRRGRCRPRDGAQCRRRPATPAAARRRARRVPTPRGGRRRRRASRKGGRRGVGSAMGRNELGRLHTAVGAMSRAALCRLHR